MLENMKSVRLSLIFLLLVMGGRTALFVSNFDALLVIPSIDITPLSILFAAALLLAVPACAYVRGRSNKKDRIRKVATITMVGAAFTDGVFNVAEAVILATDTGVFDSFSGVVLGFFWVATVLLGVAPTFLTIGLATLAGERERSESNKKSKVQSGSGSSGNKHTKKHAEVVLDTLEPNTIFSRSDIENVTQLGKTSSHAILQYLLENQKVSKHSHGKYIIH